MTSDEIEALTLDDLRVECGRTYYGRVNVVDGVAFIVDALDSIQTSLGLRGVVPEFSRDIAAAWLLVDDAWERDRKELILGGAPGRYSADFLSGPKARGAKMRGAKAPEAICRAYLKAHVRTPAAP
jgi:hypothetical protein